jgi:hypothetical protein
VVGHGITRDAEKPSDKRGSLPFETAQGAKGVAEDFRGQVFGGGPVADTLCNIGVYAMEVGLV